MRALAIAAVLGLVGGAGATGCAGSATKKRARAVARAVDAQTERATRAGILDVAAHHAGRAYQRRPSPARRLAWARALTEAGLVRQARAALGPMKRKSAYRKEVRLLERALGRLPTRISRAPPDVSWRVHQDWRAGRLGAAIRRLAPVARADPRALLWWGQLLWRQGKRVEARRRWSWARALLAQVKPGKGNLRVLPVTMEGIVRLGWQGRSLVVMRTRKRPDTLMLYPTWVEVWDPEAAEPRVSMLLGQKTPWVSAVAPDGAELALRDVTGRMRRFDLRTVRWRPALTGAPRRALTVGYGPGGQLVLGAGGGKVLVFDRRGRLRHRVQLGGKTLQVRRVYTGEGAFHHNIPTRVRSRATGFAFSPNGQRLAIASSDSSVWLSEIGGAEAPVRLTFGWKPLYRGQAVAPRNHASALGFTADGRTLVAVHPTGVNHWDVTGAKLSGQVALRCTRAEYDRSARRLTKRDPRPGDLTKCAAPTVAALAAGATRFIGIQGFYGGRFLRRAADGGTIAALDKGPTGRVAFSADGRKLVFGGVSGGLEVRDGRTGQPRWGPPRHHLQGSLVAVAPDGRHLIVQEFAWQPPRPVHLWRLAKGRRGKRLQRWAQATAAPAFGPRGKRLYLPVGKRVLVWDLVGGRQLRVLGPYARQVGGVVPAPRGGRVALLLAEKVLVDSSIAGARKVSLEAYRVAIWSPGRGAAKVVHHLGAPAAQVTDLHWSGDGRRLLTTGFDRTARIWDWRARRVLVKVTRPAWTFGPAVAWPPDGKIFATAGHGAQRVTIWNAETGREIDRFAEGRQAGSLAFSADGRRLYVGLRDGALLGWRRVNARVTERPTGDWSVKGVAALAGRPVVLAWVLGSGVQVRSRDLSRHLATIRPVTGGNWIVESPAGALDASPGGEPAAVTLFGDAPEQEGFSWRLGWDRFHVPGLLTRVLAGRAAGPP